MELKLIEYATLADWASCQDSDVARAGAIALESISLSGTNKVVYTGEPEQLRALLEAYRVDYLELVDKIGWWAKVINQVDALKLIQILDETWEERSEREFVLNKTTSFDDGVI